MSVHVIRSTAAPVGAPLSTQIGNHWIQTTTGGHWVAIDTTTTGWYDMKTLKGLGTPGEVNTTISEGTGESVVLPKMGVTLPFKSLKAGSNISITSTTSELTFSVSDVGEKNKLLNQGSGLSLVGTKVGPDLGILSLKSGTGIELKTVGSDIVIGLEDKTEKRNPVIGEVTVDRNAPADYVISSSQFFSMY